MTQPTITYEAVPVSVVCSCGSPMVRQSTPREYRVYRCHACGASIYVPRRYATGTAEELPEQWKAKKICDSVVNPSCGTPGPRYNAGGHR